MRKLNVNINMSDTDMVSCNECKGTEFIQVHQIRRISPVISPSGEETFIPIPTSNQLCLNTFNQAWEKKIEIELQSN